MKKNILNFLIVSLFLILLTPQINIQANETSSGTLGNYCCNDGYSSCLGSKIGNISDQLDLFSNNKTEFDKIQNQCLADYDCIVSTSCAGYSDPLPEKCSSLALQKCKNQAECNNKTGFWANTGCMTATECTNSGYNTYDGGCWSFPKCDTTHTENCIFASANDNPTACVNVGGTIASTTWNGVHVCFKGTATPTPTACTTWTYSDWTTCSSNTQTRTILTSTPAGCTGGTPEPLSQACTPTPTGCTADTECATGEKCTSGVCGKAGEAACISFNSAWTCSCPTNSWTQQQCKDSSSCQTGKCSKSVNDMYCCASGATVPSAGSGGGLAPSGASTYCDCGSATYSDEPCKTTCTSSTAPTCVCADGSSASPDSSSSCDVPCASTNPSAGGGTPAGATSTDPKAGGGTPDTTYKIPNFLGTTNPSDVVGRIVSFILGLAGTAGLVMFLIGGGYWIFSAGEPKMIKKGKDTLIWATIGLIFLFSSYVLIRFVFKFFGL